MDTGKRNLHGPGCVPPSRLLLALLESSFETDLRCRDERGAQSHTNYITVPLACQGRHPVLLSPGP
jgi:hypothetical protein